MRIRPGVKRRSSESAGVRIGWWAAPLVGVVLLVNLAGVWEIATALRGLREQAERTLRLETTARARAVESVLSSTTVDLAFLVGAPSLSREEARSDERWRDDAGSALLLFLRGHPQVRNLVVRDAAGQPLIEAGRPRGVPGFWVPGPTAPSLDVRGVPLRRELELNASGSGSGAPAGLAALLDPDALARAGAPGDGADRLSCALLDATGARLAGAEEAAVAEAAARAEVEDGEWGGAGPWSLACIQAAAAPAAELAPLVARHRTTIALNLVVMLLAIGLGTFALHEQRRRRELEARARHEARVRELERQLFHAERLGTVGRLAAGMAHEINNPLEGITNYLRLAADAAERGEDERLRRHLDGVRQGLDRAAAIVRRVLDHADPSAALGDRVELRQVVTEAVEFVRSRKEFDAIRFEVDLPPENLTVRGSAVLLGQVFLNLVLNACEAQPGGGEVVVRARRAGGLVEAEVADRGPGVPAGRRSRIFEPFESTKRSAGLGLSICHSIVERHGGELTLHERDGGGALFRLRIAALVEAEENACGAG